jgi:hypothetical protein
MRLARWMRRAGQDDMLERVQGSTEKCQSHIKKIPKANLWLHRCGHGPSVLRRSLCYGYGRHRG